jgi:hypothetical protein
MPTGKGIHIERNPWHWLRFPGLREILKVQYATKPREPKRRKGNFELSKRFRSGSLRQSWTCGILL